MGVRYGSGHQMMSIFLQLRIHQKKKVYLLISCFFPFLIFFFRLEYINLIFLVQRGVLKVVLDALFTLYVHWQSWLEFWCISPTPKRARSLNHHVRLLYKNWEGEGRKKNSKVFTPIPHLKGTGRSVCWTTTKKTRQTASRNIFKSS